ncbi:potassium-transporting ATPase subunit KdpA [Synechocystis salina]|uniref:Potassium-transporting ATPase potassium-binding subunit n=1 Tax=Synechocystis salina LEGE 00031 TaxID=1828736 RepID=A0ABR9VWI8_9SYNC|nr:potassium-transporting ATPase subunit KdpA [Synechocystis salina]MBE9242735.1 potassium-transporting ATPase subunit A [Synechocystis salina LEGE 00041]MBE9255732.1 potassium-transporting ATPase subunit A [Synechocystis salina LEGE 00031]
MWQGFVQIALILAILVATAPLLGRYMARVFLGQSTWLDKITRPVESLIFAGSGITENRPMGVAQYISAVLISNLVMGVFVFLILMLQGSLPLNLTALAAPSWDLALHTAISFVTNTNQQHYSGETTYTYFSQAGALGFLMFTSAATGIAVAIAFIRGLSGQAIGNFYQDLVLSITRILLPISLVGAILLLLAGVPETLAGPAQVTTLEGATQWIARGPVAHFEIIKELGENGGGFFGVNSAHPFENPNNFANLLETVIMMVIPAGLIITYGTIAGNPKQGWLIFWMVFILYVILITVAAVGEFHGNPLVNQIFGETQPNLEGKEVRLGWVLTALWAVSTTGTMCGAVNGMHDSLMPPGGFVTLSDMFLQIIWGGQGTGTAYLFVFLILTVFLTGLMVGRTPEFLGRKIEKREIVLASLILLIHPIAILIPTAITLAFPDTLAGISNPGFHGISQVAYEYASAAANNGSGFEGLADNTLWWNLSASFSLIAGRYVPIVALIFLADGMARKQPVPETSGTLHTDTTLFTGITAGAIIILGALTFLPILVLGPVAEAFNLV